MIIADDLIALVQNYNPKTDADLIARAYDYGQRMHEGQTRHSGEPYFTHPIAVAAILTEQKLDDATIVTALLHDTVEDTRSTFLRSPKNSVRSRRTCGWRHQADQPATVLDRNQTGRKLPQAVHVDV